MSHISYALVVHQVSGRIVYKTRNKTGGDVNPTIKNGTILPFDDVCYIGETLQPDYVIGRISLDDHENINYETQRWNSDATPEEIASYKDVVNTADATDALSASKEVMALITVLAPLHEMSVEALTDAVIAQLKNEEA